MKKMKHSGKKILSVFLAVLMVMTAWVFVAPTEAEATAAEITAANQSALTTVTGGGTTVSANVFGQWPYPYSGSSDWNGYTDAEHATIYKNVIYSQPYAVATSGASESGNTSYASGSSAKTQLFGNIIGKNYGTLYGYNATTTLVYDGKNTPSTAVMFMGDGDSSTSSIGDDIAYQTCYFTNADGFSLKEPWRGSDGSPNFDYTWLRLSSQIDYTSNHANASWQVRSKNNQHFYANILYFTGSMNNDTYYISRNITFNCYMGTGNYEYMTTFQATSNNPIYVINVVPWQTAVDKGIEAYNEIAANPSKYTTASVAKYVELANALLAANPNNYINSSVNNVTGWASAAQAAVNAYNSWSGLEVQKYSVTFKDINGDEKDTQTYDYGTTVNLAELAASVSNTLKQGNEQGHQTYTWGNLSTSHIVTDDVTISESPKAIVAHTYGSYTQNADNHQRTCSVCGYVQIQDHTRGTGYVTKEETCTEDGIMTYNCSVCGKKAIETSVINNITGHNFEGSAVENVTGENGNHWKKCSRCDAYGWAGILDACENHNWDKNSDGQVNASDATSSKASTCKEAGFETYTCKVCSATWTKTLDLAAHTITATAKKDVANQCGGDGNEAFWKCSVCDRVWKDEALTNELTDTTDADGDGVPDALETKGPDHSFTGAYVSTSAGKDGTHHRQCARFTQCKTYGPEEKHNWGEPAVTDATCEKEGKEVYTCTSGCGQTYEKTLDKIPHNMTKIPAVAPECGKAGNNEYYSCSICSKYYKDEAGTTETTVSAEKLSALEHKWTAHHDYDTLNTAADCMKPAVYNNHCDYCKVLLTGATHYYGDPDTVNGHKFNGETQKNADGTHSYKCTVAGCTAYGNETKCSYEVTEDVASTCHTVGYTIHKCATCGKEKRVEKTGYDFTNHDGETEVRFALDAKCNTNGYTGDTYCLGCNTKIATGTTIIADKTVHPHENMKDYEAKAPTCQTEGYKAYRYCDQCGTYEIAKVTVPVRAHSFTKYTTNNNGTHTATCDTCDATVATPVTDTKDCSGGTANCVDKAVCAVCSGAYGDVDSANHKTRTFVAKVDSTCQVEGTEAYYKCTACNTNIDTPVVIAKKDHSYGAWTKIDGKDEHTRSCTTCDAAVAEVATEIAPCSGGVANCLDKARCSTCKSEYGSTNPDVHKTEANTLKDVVAATCQAAGFSGNYRYNCCDAIKVAGKETEKLAHEFSIEVEGSRVPATCIAKGEVTYKCSTCVESEGVTAATQKKELPIDAKKHASEETITVNAKAATCESDGHTGDVYYSCCYDSTKTEAENRKALKEKGTVIKANGQHIYGEAVPEYMIKEIVETKDKNGKVTSRTIVEKTGKIAYDEMIAARRDDDKWYHAQICTICYEVTYDACYTYAHTSNCVETDTCEICEGLCSLKTPLVHPVELDYVAEKSATCTENGVKAHYKCRVCGEKFSDALGKKPVSDDALKISSAGGNHNYSSAKPIDGEDKHEYSCTRCSAKIEEDCSGGEATCKAKAKCSVCGQEYDEIDEKNHITDEVVIVGKKDATCSEGGYTGDSYYKCCYVDGAVDNSKAFKAMGEATPSESSLHVIAYKDIEGDTHTAYCTACKDAENAYSVTVAHEWVEGETPELESCTDEVVITSTCVCGKTKTKTIVGEHDFEITVETKAATCSEAGYKKTFKACKKCNYSVELPEEILEKLPHNIVTEEAVKPTCDGVGKHAYTYCKNPGCPYGYKKDLFIGSLAGYEAYKNNDGKTVDKLGHQDKDNNGSCDNCYNPLKENIDGTRCNCICHKQNILMKIIYKILQFFWKLFKIEQTCGCGTKHW